MYACIHTYINKTKIRLRGFKAQQAQVLREVEKNYPRRGDGNHQIFWDQAKVGGSQLNTNQIRSAIQITNNRMPPDRQTWSRKINEETINEV